ncbi:hypothetical protein ACFYNY_20140 [Streptomyces sp. NPDC006530]|uniref:hypothetical protein n=1 Tax=Streptomyces sp. NPDC006530 TaxID=3364750 RepID=UPI00367DECBB
MQADLDRVRNLLSGAAFNLAEARIAHGLLRWKAEADYDTIRRAVANEQWDVFETSAIDACLRSVVTALDLGAAALFRLGGLQPGRSETDLGRWDREVASKRLRLPVFLTRWAELRNSPEYRELRERRNEATHRTREVAADVGASAAVSIDYGGVSRPVLKLSEEIAGYGRRKFHELCNAILDWGPETPVGL